MARVVVTGAAGFIGWHLVRALDAAGHAVHALDLRGRPPGYSDRVAYRSLDIRDAAAVRRVVEDADTVYHLASAHLDVGATEESYREINVDATRALAEACAAAGVRRLVHTSTVGIYGHVEHPPAREDTPPAPGNMYERTKLEGEEALRHAVSPSDLELVILRPSWVYGPGCHRTAKLLRTVRRGRFFYIGSGSNLRHPVFIDDVMAAYALAAATSLRGHGRAYLIAGPRYMTLRELVDTCAAVLAVPPPRRRLPTALAGTVGHAAELAWGSIGRQPPFSRRSIAFFENDNAFDIEAARLDLGYEPRVDLAEGLRRTLASADWPVGV